MIFKLYPIALGVYEGERISKYLSYYDDDDDYDDYV